MSMCYAVMNACELWSTDADGDPSVHPKTATIFLSRSASDKHRRSMYHILDVGDTH